MTALVAVLAGGRGRRMGAPKPLAELGGAPLIERPLAAAADGRAERRGGRQGGHAAAGRP